MTTINTTNPLLAQWMSGGDENSTRITRPHAQSGTVFACVEAIINSALSMQMMLSTEGDKIVESGDAYNFAFRNRELPFSRLLTYTLGIYALDRFVYWITPDAAVGKPSELIVASRLQCKPAIQRGVIVGYYLHMPDGSRQAFTVQEVYCIYGFDPYGRIGIPSATSPVVAGSSSIGADAMSSMYAESLYANGARPDGVIEYPGNPDITDIERMRNDWQARHGGVKAAGSTAILTGGSKYSTIANTLAELDTVNFKNMNKREICSVMGTPSEVVNLSDEAQYTNGPAQQRFIINTIIPLVNIFAEHYTTAILDRFSSRQTGKLLEECKSFTGRKSLQLNQRAAYNQAKHKAINRNQTNLFAWFNYDEHPTVRQMNFERTKEAFKITEYGVPYNEVVDAYDLPFTNQAWGNTSFMNAGKLPVESLLETDPEPTGSEKTNQYLSPEQVGKAADNTKAPTTAAVTAMYAQHIASMRKHEKGYTQAMRAFFRRQQRSVETAIKQFFKSDKSKGKQSTQQILKLIFDIKAENKKLIAINKTFFNQAVTTGAGVINEMLDSSEDDQQAAMTSLLVKAAISAQSQKIVSVNQTTRNMISKLVNQSVADGDNYATVVNKLQTEFALRLNSARITAQTQIATAVNTGRQAAMVTGGVKKKAWYSASDGNVRSDHAQAMVDYSKGIDINKPFIVGGEALMYPGDPSGSAGNIIGCRCMSIPIMN